MWLAGKDVWIVELVEGVVENYVTWRCTFAMNFKKFLYFCNIDPAKFKFVSQNFQIPPAETLKILLLGRKVLSVTKGKLADRRKIIKSEFSIFY